MMSSDNNGSRAKETNTADDLSAKSGGISIGIKNYGKVLIQQHYRCRADTNDNMGPQSCSMAGFAPFITNGSTTASGHKKAKKIDSTESSLSGAKHSIMSIHSYSG